MELDEENSSPTPVSLSGSPRAQTDGEDTGEVVPSVRPIAIPTHPLGFSQGTTRSVLNYDGVGGLRPLHSQYSGQVNSPLSASVPLHACEGLAVRGALHALVCVPSSSILSAASPWHGGYASFDVRRSFDVGWPCSPRHPSGLSYQVLSRARHSSHINN